MLEAWFLRLYSMYIWKPREIFLIFHQIECKKKPSYGTYKWKLSKIFQTVRIVGT